MAIFRTRARAVDMLGRQQIAGIPTAISELFKNAHDAYADRVEVDYHRADRLMILRDDGVGMTTQEFLDRWLTIGTESKIQGRTSMGPPPADPAKPRRAVLGEKGIGRLAIAAIGPQVLVLSHAARSSGSEIVAAYIHWGLFEIPGVDLEEIEVPLLTLQPGTLPSRAQLAAMVSAAERTLELVRDRADGDAAARIAADFEAMKTLDPEEFESYLPSMDLRDSRGTHFILAAVHDTLDADIEGGGRDEASSLEKLLLGFTNTMTPGHPPPVIGTAFRDHPTNDYTEDLVDKARFFTPEEFSNADHHITGHFDPYGQFEGTVSVYGEPHEAYRVAWAEAQGKQTECGAFEVHLAVVQPEPRSTTLPPEQHQLLLSKTRRFGGLYIYRDGIRILPYGDVDYDWLEIEKRRTLKASYYYFSHRNIFGAVLLSSELNGSLNEKAGREGFRENKAYRQLRSVLKNFFSQVAGDFFREEGTYAEDYLERKDELQRQYELLKRREASVTGRRRKFAAELDSFFTRHEANEPAQTAMALAEQVETELARATSLNDPAEAAAEFLRIEAEAREALRAMEDGYRIAKPRGVGLGRKLLREYEDYSDSFAHLQGVVFSDVRNLIEGDVTAAAKRARVELDLRLRIQQTLDELATQIRREARMEKGATQESLSEVHGQVQDATQQAIREVDEVITRALAEFSSTEVTELDQTKALALRDQLEERLLLARDSSTRLLKYLRAQLETIDVSGENAHLDQVEALEQRNLDLEERAEYDLQLAQLGMAVDVINHEFDASVRAIRHDLRRLRTWADLNEGLQDVYGGLRTSFDHLDSYLTLFTPLHRRLNRERTEIVGSDVARYLRDLFSKRFERHHVELEVTPEFAAWSVIEYPSSFYPVFVNLVDNAVFWLDQRAEGRVIQLHATDQDVFISNTGPAIPGRRHQVIFDQGVSFKPAGRGLGLFISREVLRQVGYDLAVVAPKPPMTVSFRIGPRDGE